MGSRNQTSMARFLASSFPCASSFHARKGEAHPSRWTTRIELHDFGDEHGPVPAHRHAYGGGWVAETATVAATVYVGFSAKVYGRARVDGEAHLGGDAHVGGEAHVGGKARVCGEARVSDRAHVGGMAVLYCEARVGGDAHIGDSITGYDLSDVPVVADLDARLAEAIEADDTLDMNQVSHACHTHCRAGWAIHLAGEAGYALERRVGWWLAGALIYVASTGRSEVPDFFATDVETREDIIRRAARAMEV